MSSIENEYNQMEQDNYEEFLEFKEWRDRERGIVEGSPIGDTLHPKTIKSYSKSRFTYTRFSLLRIQKIGRANAQDV